MLENQADILSFLAFTDCTNDMVDRYGMKVDIEDLKNITRAMISCVAD